MSECPICHVLFRATGNRRYCSAECAHEAELQQGREWRVQKRRQRARETRRETTPEVGADINEVLRELERYNREHGTHLSYGQYVHKQRMGML